MVERTNTPPVSLENPAKLAEIFYKETGNRNDMTKEQFFNVTGCKSVFFGNRFFETLANKDSGKLNIGEMMDGFAQLRASKLDDRIRFIFRIFDLDEDGVITHGELKKVIEASVKESDTSMSEEETSNLIEALFQLFDADGNKYIDINEFSRVLRNYPDLLQGLTFGGFGRIHSQNIKEFRRSRVPLWLEKVQLWILDNPQFIITYGLSVLLIILAFLWMFLKFFGDCDGSEMELVDPLTGYNRNEIASMIEENSGILSEEDKHYMVFSNDMSKLDPIECRDARKRKLLGWALPLAKGSAQAMKVVFTLILLPVSRTFMTTLRETFLKNFLYFDGAIEFHKFLGRIGFLLAWTHTFCHVAGIIKWRDDNRFRYWSWAFPDKRTLWNMEGVMRYENGTVVRSEEGKPQPNGTLEDGMPLMVLNTKNQPDTDDLLFSVVAITGIVLIVIYTGAALFAFDYPKKLKIFQNSRGRSSRQFPWYRTFILRIGQSLNDFNNFWYSHHLFSIFYVALVLHPIPVIPEDRHEAGTYDTWMWVIVPVLIYLTERMLRIKRSTCYTRVVGAEVLPGDVVGLRMLRPKGFRYTPGQYVFIRCPEISLFEWHPFTLTSCPGDSYLGVHIRRVGDWTGALYKLAKDHVIAKTTDSMATTSSQPDGIISRYLLKPVIGEEIEVQERFPFSISVDGPFGAPAQDYSDYKVIVLIGAGIGVTPFASVLTDLIDAMKRTSCQYCGRTNTQIMRTQLHKAYFYWTVRSRSEASWFKHLLEEIALRDTEGLLEININITGIKGAKDLRTMMLSLAQYEYDMESASDVHSRAVTRFGRINWTLVFDKVQADFPNVSNVGVFYCGPNRLAKQLTEMCITRSRGPTKFSFMKEYFG